MPAATPELVLISDADPEIAEFLAARLRADGFDTALARDGYQALAGIALRRPGIVLLEADLPFIDGLALTRQLRADPATASLPIILLGAQPSSADKIAGLKAGADDYIAKPFDPAEVSARIDSAIRRHREVRESSPLTGMPGNDRILRELQSWIKRGDPFALCYIDIDQFKAVNDVYGFVRGDEFIRALAECVYAAAGDAGAAPVFLGHVGGDDFTILCLPDHAEAVTGFLNDHFARRVRAALRPPRRRTRLHRARRPHLPAPDPLAPAHPLHRRRPLHPPPLRRRLRGRRRGHDPQKRRQIPPRELRGLPRGPHPRTHQPPSRLLDERQLNRACDQ